MQQPPSNTKLHLFICCFHSAFPKLILYLSSHLMSVYNSTHYRIRLMPHVLFIKD